MPAAGHGLRGSRRTSARTRGCPARCGGPSRAWVRAATTGEPRLPARRAAVRAFRLFDGHGHYIDPAGVPADIEPLDGTRVVVLHPPNGTFTMGGGRVFTHMAPTLTLDRRLGAREAASRLARVRPAVEDDLMAP